MSRDLKKEIRYLDQITTLTYVLMDNFCPCFIEKGLTTLRSHKFWIFHHTTIKISFKMVKFIEHEKL